MMVQTMRNYKLTGQFSELKEQEHEESTEENQSRDGNNSAQKKEIEPFIKGEIGDDDGDEVQKRRLTQLFYNKENSPPNTNTGQKPGRFSL